jgi:hydroxypyruvate isomerase
MAGMTQRRRHAAVHRTYLANLALAAAGAAKHGLTVLIEPLNSVDRPGYFLRTSDQAAAIIDELKLPNLKLLFDVYHVQIAEGDILRRFDRHYDKIAGVPSRTEPDDGELNYRVILREIARRNWNGWVGCEYKPRATTEEGLGWIRNLTADWDATGAERNAR